MRQRWEKLLFLHWPVAPEMVQALLPSGLTVDTFGGRAYVGLVPFTMRGVRPVWSPSVPGLSHFHECNVRTYVHENGREPGVWFWSLDAANPLAVKIARGLWHLPYFHARMNLTEESGKISYSTTRTHRNAPGGECHVRYRPQGAPAPATPETLPYFLAERYILYAEKRNRLYKGRVHHVPYPLQEASVEKLTETLVQASGLPPSHLLSDTPLAHYAEGVNVEVFPLQPL
jgi:hypothetical protein